MVRVLLLTAACTDRVSFPVDEHGHYNKKRINKKRSHPQTVRSKGSVVSSRHVLHRDYALSIFLLARGKERQSATTNYRTTWHYLVFCTATCSSSLLPQRAYKGRTAIAKSKATLTGKLLVQQFTAAVVHKMISP